MVCNSMVMTIFLFLSVHLEFDKLISCSDVGAHTTVDSSKEACLRARCLISLAIAHHQNTWIEHSGTWERVAKTLVLARNGGGLSLWEDNGCCAPVMMQVSPGCTGYSYTYIFIKSSLSCLYSTTQLIYSWICGAIVLSVLEWKQLAIRDYLEAWKFKLELVRKWSCFFVSTMIIFFGTRGRILTFLGPPITNLRHILLRRLLNLFNVSKRSSVPFRIETDKWPLILMASILTILITPELVSMTPDQSFIHTTSTPSCRR